MFFNVRLVIFMLEIIYYMKFYFIFDNLILIIDMMYVLYLKWLIYGCVLGNMMNDLLIKLIIFFI